MESAAAPTPTLIELRDRIVGLERLPAREVLPSDFNWREHPSQQAEAVEESLGRWGIYEPLLAYVADDGKLRLFDGHLRDERIIARLGQDQIIPVIRTDLTEAEARQVIVTHDPLSAMAQANSGKLADLLREHDAAGDATARMLTDLAASNGIDWNSLAAEQAAPPADFPSVGEDIAVEHQCPRCRYVWSGSTAPVAAEAK